MVKVKSVKKRHVKVGDMVVIISGRDRSKRGRVIALGVNEGKAIVSGLNKVHKHLKARRAGDESGVLEVEAPICTDKLQLICPHCNSATRVGHRMNDKNLKVRFCKKCKKDITSK